MVERGQPVVFDVSVNKIKGEITGVCESDFLIMLYSSRAIAPCFVALKTDVTCRTKKYYLNNIAITLIFAFSRSTKKRTLLLSAKNMGAFAPFV